jgi:hypothetical protein
VLAGCAGSEQELCALAGEHLQSCTGVAVHPPSDCDVHLAQQVATDCAELENGARGTASWVDDVMGWFDDRVEWAGGLEWAGWFGSGGGGGTTYYLTAYGAANCPFYQGLPACGGRRVDGNFDP